MTAVGVSLGAAVNSGAASRAGYLELKIIDGRVCAESSIWILFI